MIVLVIRAKSNRLDDLKLTLPDAIEKLVHGKPGSVLIASA